MNNTQKYDWPALITQQIESGDTVAQFCRDNKLVSKSFYNNRAKISVSQTTTAFIKVQTQISPSKQLSLTIGGATLAMPVDIDAIWLATLLRELA
jgi:hypothetical protein